RARRREAPLRRDQRQEVVAPRGRSDARRRHDVPDLCMRVAALRVRLRRQRRLGFKNWSGAWGLNPGPHGPEPYVVRVLPCPARSVVVLLPCPAGSFSVPLCSISTAVVSSRVLLYPPGSANA